MWSATTKNDAENVVSEEQPELVKQPQRTTKNKGVKIVLIALILVLACGAGYFAFYKYQDQQEKDRIAKEQALTEQKKKMNKRKKIRSRKPMINNKKIRQITLMMVHHQYILWRTENTKNMPLC